MLNRIVPDGTAFHPLKKALEVCRAHLWWAAAFSALVNVLYLTPTLYMMQVYDRVVPTGGIETLILLTVVTIIALASLSALDWLRTRLLIRASLRLDRALTPEILNRQGSSADSPSSARLMRDFDQVRTAIGGQGTLALFDAPWTPFYLLCCFLLHPAIGLLTLAGGAALILLAIANEAANRNQMKSASERVNAAHAAQEAMAGQAEVIRALGMKTTSVQRQANARFEAVTSQAKVQLTGGQYSSLIKFLRLSLQSLALGLAAWLVVKGQMSAGAIIASSVLLSRAVAPIELLVGAWPSLVQGRTSWLALVQLFQQTVKEIETPTQLPKPKGHLSVESAGVRQQGAASFQLHPLSLALEPGQILGVIGPSGSGKSTLARLLAGALSPTHGTIRLDGADYKAWNSDALATHIGYLPQAPSLFAGTIKQNISRFSTPVDGSQVALDHDVVAAAQAAGAHDLILQLAQGYDTQLGPFGQGLSAGQAQRIALARALLRNPALIVLDEPNSNLDQEGERALSRAIRSAADRQATIVIVAHRAGILAQAHRLALIVDGKLQAEGPREVVLSHINAPASSQA